MKGDNGRRDRIEDQDSVKVCVRIRPLSSKERQEHTRSCVRIADSVDGLTSNNPAAASLDDGVKASREPQQLIVGKDRAFTFDNILGVTSSQKVSPPPETYRLCVVPLVQGFLEGYNATVLAYGQTGTGKTHTMAGSGFDARGQEKNEELQGIIPRVIKAVFSKLQQQESGDNQRRTEHTLRVEYVEIYNEELRDLLHPETPSRQLAIREDGEGNIVVAGAKSEPADSKAAVFRHLVVGGASRVTGSTLMNEQSSRSHAIFSLLLEQRDVASGSRRLSKFHLVDLAGSERAKRTGAVAGRFKESVSINQGLLALGNVISALGDDKRRVGSAGSGSNAVHVPYRDSKLTRLLQDSLGGNSRTLMIACVSPAGVNFEETLNTLKYANRAKNITNKPIVNQHVAASEEQRQRSDEELSRMKEEIASLQTQLQQQQKPVTPASRPSSSVKKTKRKEEDDIGQSQQLATASQELAKATKCVRQYGDAVESMRTYSMEAATLLVAMEREIKSLGRPVQQRLNEVVKLLNAAIQTANGSDASAKKLMASSDRRRLDGDADPATQEGDEAQGEEETMVVHRLRQELKDAKTNLTRDEQIFEMKNADIQRLQALLVEAKGKHDKLVQRVQELERGGQLWSNAKTKPSLDALERIASLETEAEERQGPSRATTAAATGRSPRLSCTAGSKASTSSSRGLFTRRASTAAYDDEDKVLMGNADEDADAKETAKPPASRSGSRGASSRSSASRLKTSEAIAKLEQTVATLQAKLEELQQQNVHYLDAALGELLDAREESTRRWALDRQNYERQISEAEHSLEELRRANQTLEDAMLEEKQADAKDQTPSDEKERPETAASRSSSRPRTAARAHDAEQIDSQAVVALFESSVQQLVEFHGARRQVLRLLKGKQEAQQNKSEATRRVNALEMQKLRQSLGVRESISSLSKSMVALDEKMQAESRSLEELERLRKLRARAERKLTTLRKQDEQATFLDGEAQQELLDLEELLVDLDSHIAFQDAELETARSDLLSIKQRSEKAGEDGQSPLDALASAVAQQLSASDATVVMRKCLDEVARLRVRTSDLGHEVQELQEAVNERDTAVTQLEGGLTVARDEFDRRLAAQQRESALAIENMKKMQPQVLVSPGGKGDEADTEQHKDDEWQKLIVRCQKKDEYIADLEKHLVFYKSKAKQMQAQLQQLIRASSEQQRASEDCEDPRDDERERQLQRRIQQLEDANDELMKDLATAKIYLRASQSRGSVGSSGGAPTKVVRVSRSELRELPAPPPLASSHVADSRG
ncbi:hypothetical protein BBJ28_00002138 [Nothophytophthora sp. Chile5]|nr:hypothetical protein BBJ28_00002138 [Nothophytophthora sp. Chile5]